MIFLMNIDAKFLANISIFNPIQKDNSSQLVVYSRKANKISLINRTKEINLMILSLDEEKLFCF